MYNNFFNFIYWLNIKEKLYSNKELIDKLYNNIIIYLEENNIHIINPEFKNEIVALVYRHSKYSEISVGYENYIINQKKKDSVFFDKYEMDIVDIFNDFKSYLLENKINILDKNHKFQLNNFMEIIIRDTEIKEQYISDNEEEHINDSDFEY